MKYEDEIQTLKDQVHGLTQSYEVLKAKFEAFQHYLAFGHLWLMTERDVIRGRAIWEKIQEEKRLTESEG